METGTAVLNDLLSQLDEMGMSSMANSLNQLYHSPSFLEMDRLTLLRELIDAEYQARAETRFSNRLKKAGLMGNPCEISNCVNSREREYLPPEITETLSSLGFVNDGLNVCVLGPSDSGKSYLAKALAIQACHYYRVAYFHCNAFTEEMAALKNLSFEKYKRKMRYFMKLDLLVLDDFLLHTISDESELKVLFEILEKRSELMKSTIVCSQREPRSWASMMLNDEVTSNAILNRVTKHYTVLINPKADL